MSSNQQREVIVAVDTAALAAAAAQRLMRRVARDGRSAVCLTGGSSPEGLYRLLAEEPWRGKVPWDRVHWFMGDDRFVPQSDPLSNMGMARRLFLARGRRAARQHSPDSDRRQLSRRRGAIFTKTSSRVFTARNGSIRRGRCSISCSWVSAPTATPPRCFRARARSTKRTAGCFAVAKAGMEPFVPRVTLTFPALASTREMLFLVDGAGKRDILQPRVRGRRFAGRRAYSDGELVWLLDRAAAPETGMA